MVELFASTMLDAKKSDIGRTIKAYMEEVTKYEDKTH
jgi:orotidine-5'-phosphate decarboxylase